MPIYEYSCRGCEHEVEILQRSIADHPTCPECGGTNLEKQLSVPAKAAVKSGGSSLPVTSEACEAPRCCGGGCQI